MELTWVNWMLAYSLTHSNNLESPESRCAWHCFSCLVHLGGKNSRQWWHSGKGRRPKLRECCCKGPNYENAQWQWGGMVHWAFAAWMALVSVHTKQGLQSEWLLSQSLRDLVSWDPLESCRVVQNDLEWNLDMRIGGIINDPLDSILWATNQSMISVYKECVCFTKHTINQ